MLNGPVAHFAVYRLSIHGSESNQLYKKGRTWAIEDGDLKNFAGGSVWKLTISISSLSRKTKTGNCLLILKIPAR
jgi:hypothetical protein